jgi:Aspartyl protease
MVLLKWSELEKRLTPRRVVFAIATGLMSKALFLYVHAQAQSSTADLDELLQQKEYVGLEQALATKVPELAPLSRAYFDGIMANRTNGLRKSRELLEGVLPALIVSNPARAEIALCALADDYAKGFRYDDAAQKYAEASGLAESQHKVSACDAAREASRWALLTDAPAQTIHGSRAFTVQGKRDAIGLFQVRVAVGNYTGSWIVDSGANLSIISRSVADKMGLKLSISYETAQGVSGRTVAIRTAVIPEMRLGQAVLRNVAVLVAGDSDLTFRKLRYQIEGSLGIPVLAALGRITFYPDGRVAFSQVTQATAKNIDSHTLFFEKFTPVITADLEYGNQLFSLDTGAVGTVLSAEFYKEAKASLDPAQQVSLELVGAGGSIVLPAYMLRGVVAKVGGECTTIEQIQILTEPISPPDEFYGNIGQNSLSSFTSFTLDFNTMQFSTTGGNPGDCLR